MQGLNPGLLHCRQMIHQLNYEGSSIITYNKMYRYRHTQVNTRQVLHVECVCVSVRVCEHGTHREKKRYVKELALATVGLVNLNFAGWAGRLETQGRAEVVARVQRPSGGRIPSSSEEVALLYFF